jgi:CRISPR-associated protein Csm1
MDDTVYKIALAGLLHDIGKFMQRAAGVRNTADELNVAFYPDEEFINNNRDLYQPHYQNNYTHQHAVYTAAFIDHVEKLLPKRFNKGEWGLGDSFMNIAAGHHKPDTAMQWIIAVADRVSSGFDRETFEKSYNLQSEIANYKKVRLVPIFEQLTINSPKADFQYRYKLSELSPDNIFPVFRRDAEPDSNEKASDEYRKLFEGFIYSLDDLSKGGHLNNIPLWLEHFDSLYMIYASHIPASTVGDDIPDVSLYDHSKMTAALASALYRYHDEFNNMEIDEIKDYQTRKFLVINGDFYGIQDFIFSEGGSTGKASAKLLRGRSFYISLFSELASDMLCKALGLTSLSVILNAAGKFTILAHNSDNTRNKVVQVESEINSWLIDKFYGQASIGIACTEASCVDFVTGNFPKLWARLSAAIDRKKYSRIDLNQYAGAVEGYLDKFNNDLSKKLCPFCGKRPSDPRIERDYQLPKDESSACAVCRDQIFIGSNLVKKGRLAITTVEADIKGDKLAEPVYGTYQIAFTTGKLTEVAKAEDLIKYWDISISEDGTIAKDITAKFVSGYIPKYAADDITDDAVNRILAGKKSEKMKDELFDSMEAGIPKTFAYIARMALNENTDTGKFTGIEALGVLKADVDNLGLLFACGLTEKRQTLSRLATLSRQMNNYFSIFIPYVLKTKEQFKDIYTVFAGGDDLFLIGPWNRIIDFAGKLNKTFSTYICFNPDITISAGIAVCKPGEPVHAIAERAEEALETSKNSGRNRVTLFSETSKWEDFESLDSIKNTLHDWLKRGIINKAMLYRFNEFIAMAKESDQIMNTKTFVRLEDMECFKWQPRLRYSIVRNTDKLVMDEVLESSLKWINEYKGSLKMPLWQVLYETR